MRYDQLLTLVSIYKPRTIIEIGTNNGERGLLMCEEALKHRIQVSYCGYDVFDTEDEEFHQRAFNGKGFFPRHQVASRFDGLRSRASGLRCELIEGTTAQTLHPRPACADFVFIDGDHRLETIRLDFQAVRRSNVIVFDDYYSDAPGCEKVDINRIGCNKVVDEIEKAIVLPIADRFSHVGDIRMAAVVRPHVFMKGMPIWF